MEIVCSALLGLFRKVCGDLTTDDVAIENSQIFRRWLLNCFPGLHIKLAIMFGALHRSPFEESVVEESITVGAHT